ncbi:MAG: prepilin-type N-terminal cleavage/methylation domain-containing protein [Deltaproteobacteria bacterium]|nr:prepilin-type N-terminal cleavage/methylation domain-containing protein [Deltaproteobacteria bacterium]
MRGNKGVTLIEVMVVVVIVGILAAVAIPAYNNYVTRSRRSDAFTALETVRAAQEMYRAERGFYAGALGSLPGCSAAMAGDNYTVSIVRTDNTHYTSTATAQNAQAGDFNFRIDEDGNQEYFDGGWLSDKTWEELR